MIIITTVYWRYLHAVTLQSWRPTIWGIFCPADMLHRVHRAEYFRGTCTHNISMLVCTGCDFVPATCDFCDFWPSYFVPAILSQLHETCCTEFNMLSIFMRVHRFWFCPSYVFPLHVASEHTTEVFLSLQDIPASWLLVSANLNKWHIFSKMSHTSQQRVKRSSSHWLESFFRSCLNLLPFLPHVCLSILVKIKDKLKKTITVKKSLVLQTIAFNPLPKIIFILLSLLKVNCLWIDLFA